MMPSRTVLCLLAVLALSTLAHAANTSPSFTSWLNGMHTVASKAVPAHDHDVPSRTVCLKETEDFNCACNDNDSEEIVDGTNAYQQCYNDFFFQ
jgi:hypothetical protein